MTKFAHILKAAVSFIGMSALLCGGIFAVNTAASEMSDKPAARTSSVESGEKTPSIMYAPDFDETIEKMRKDPERCYETAKRVHEAELQKKEEEKRKAASAEKAPPASAYAPDFDETIGAMRANSGQLPQ